MVSFARKLVRRLPRRRYNIFSGTNSIKEWRQMLRVWLSGGTDQSLDIIGEYERQFAKCCGVRHGISFGAGRMALYAILEVLGIGEGDDIIIPAFTCVVVPNAILYRGARPVYVDIEPRFFNIDVSKVEAAITPRTKALYAQHTFGVPCDVHALRDIGRRRGLPVIEDVAHGLGSTYHGKVTGSLTEVAFFSTDHSKVINTYLGGMVLTNDDVLASRFRAVQAAASSLDQKVTRRIIRSFLLEYILFSPLFLWIGSLIYAVLVRLGLLFYFSDELKTKRPTAYPYPCRLSQAQALLGLSQLEKLQVNLDHRRQIANWLEQKIKWNGISPDEVNESTWLRYSFLIRDRKKFITAFEKHFDLGVWFTSVVSGRQDDLQAVGYKLGSCPVAEYVVEHIVNFPTHLRVPPKMIKRELERNWGQVSREILYESREI